MDKLNLMTGFIALVEEGTFTKAAVRLGRSKALVSVNVKALESALGVRLLNRSTRHIKLTEQGQHYYEQAKQLLDGLSQLEHSLRYDSQSLAGRLRISVPTTYGEACLMPFLARLKHEQPALQIECFFQDRYVDLIAEGFDLAIRIGQLKDSTLLAKRVQLIHSYFCASPQFIARHGDIAQLGDFVRLPCIVDSNAKMEGVWMVNGEKVQVNEAIRVNSASATAELAALGVGICLCPEFALKPYIDSGQLIVLPFDSKQIPVHVVYPHRTHSVGKVNQFIEALTQFLNQP